MSSHSLHCLYPDLFFPSRRRGVPAILNILPLGSPLLQEGTHPLLAVVKAERRVIEASLKVQSIVEAQFFS